MSGKSGYLLDMNKKILREMMAEYEKAPQVYYPSNFWKELNKIHIQQISNIGFDNFKRSVNMRYFNWGVLGILIHQLLPVFSELLRGNFAPIFNSHFINPRSKANSHARSFNVVSAFIYRVYVAALRDYVSYNDTLKILNRLQEPLIGNPFGVLYKNKIISQDLCNSVHEFYSITKKINSKKTMNIAELGAGYGRLGYVFLETLPKSSYCIIDIPPALFIAQEYLSKVFPKEKIFYFRPFTSFEEVREEFESARIKFLMAHQIEYLPDKYFDLTITISSLHEMTNEQIKNYIKHIGRLTQGYFYTKQWRRSRIKDNFYIKENEYPIPKNWRVIYKERHPIQSMFFEALYKIY